MPIDPDLKSQVPKSLDRYCAQKIPLRVRDELRLVHRWQGTKVTLVEQRPLWRDASAPRTDSPVAQFLSHPDTNDWTLHWRGCNQRWHLVADNLGNQSLEQMLVEVDQDPTGIFWG